MHRDHKVIPKWYNMIRISLDKAYRIFYIEYNRILHVNEANDRKLPTIFTVDFGGQTHTYLKVDHRHNLAQAILLTSINLTLTRSNLLIQVEIAWKIQYYRVLTLQLHYKDDRY